MKNFWLVILGFIAYHTTLSQKSPIKFGVIPMEDMEMRQYPKDTSAAAVVLTDFGHAKIEVLPSMLKMHFDRHVRIKILKKEGLDWANALIELYHDGIGSEEERVYNLKASTYNLENGKIVESKMPKDLVFKEKFNKHTTHHKFTLPNVKVGSVIEYSYTVSSEDWSTFPNWEFQRSIPTRWSEFWAMVPQELQYQKYMQGYVATTSANPKYNWSAKDVPAFKPEPHMTSEREYVAKMNFALSYIVLPTRTIEIMGSWDKLSKNLLASEHWGGVIKGSGFLKKTVEEVTAGIDDPKAKIEAIFNYVRHTLNWTGTKDYSPDNLKKVFEAKKGSSGDINIALASMLTKAGFNVDMVLLSTRDHGFVRKPFPMSKQFNYVICQVRLPNEMILLDATERYLPMGLLPERCLNGEGLIVSNSNTGWVNLESKTKWKTVINTDLKLEPNGTLRGKLNFIHDGYAAGKMRNEYFRDGETEYLKKIVTGKSWEITEAKFQNTKEVDKPAIEDHSILMENHASVAGSQIYLNPFVIAHFDENPFKAETRTYPVDFTCPRESTYLCKISIPEGYAIDELPKNKILALPNNAGRFVYNVGSTGNQINITCILSINRSLFVQDEYPDLREFLNLVIAKETEQIVLKKL
jgi:hypothetical protein